MMQETLYKENLLDHYKNPRNFGKLEKWTIKKKDVNPLCGDEVEIYLLIEDEVVKDARFNGQGCVVSIAAASMLIDGIKGNNLDWISKLTEKDMFSMLGIEVGINRRKCVMLCLKALKGGLRDEL